MPFLRAQGSSSAVSGSISKDFIDAIRLHNESTLDDKCKLPVPSAKLGIYSGYILSSVREAFADTAMYEYVGVLTAEPMRMQHSKLYKKALEHVRNVLFAEYPILPLTEGHWGLKRAVRTALENKKNTTKRKKQRKSDKKKEKKRNKEAHKMRQSNEPLSDIDDEEEWVKMKGRKPTKMLYHLFHYKRKTSFNKTSTT